MKVLVLCENYPNELVKIALMFIHVRNIEYVKQGIDVTVLNFQASKSYIWEKIPVITFRDYKDRLWNEKFDVLILHAANLKHHYRFLVRFGKNFPKKLFIFHGHEILRTQKIYPEVFPYQKGKNFIYKKIVDCYDQVKISVWKKYINQHEDPNNKYIFVSNWLKNTFIKETGVNSSDFYIINNSIGKFFEQNEYKDDCEKKYDFVTIRSVLDGSKYCVDLVVKIANQYPQYKFLLIGKGDYFKYNELPGNMTWIESHLSHNEMLNYINQSKCALMLTRQDTQGVMSCELAALGMPIISSDIDVCREILGTVENAILISNKIEEVDFPAVYKKICEKRYKKNTLYYTQNTIRKEIDLLKNW